VFLADLAGSIAGRIPLSEAWNRFASTDDLAVDGRHRRADVARALLNRGVGWAARRGLAGMRADTQNNNVPDCRFYESCGFSLAGVDCDLYRGLTPGTTEIALFCLSGTCTSRQRLYQPLEPVMRDESCTSTAIYR
jgi:streptothricin acetyltransferase